MKEPTSKLAMPPIAVLAGGLATRLRPITATLPKSMLPLAGEPFIAHQLRMLCREGFEQAILLCGFLGEQIQNYVGDGAAFGMQVQYAFDGEVLRGTGGALKRALPLLGDAFMVIYGDSWCPTRYRPIWEFFHASGKEGLMTVFENNDQWDRSNVLFDKGKILAYDKEHRTPAMRHIDYGIGAYRCSAFAAWNGDSVFDLSAVQRRLLASDQLAGFQVSERFYEIGSPSGLEETDAILKSPFLYNDSQKESPK